MRSLKSLLNRVASTVFQNASTRSTMRVRAPRRLNDVRLARVEPLEERRLLSIGLYVDASASTGGDGLAWATAFDDLQDAISLAGTLNADTDSLNDVAEISVGGGTYKPTTGTDRAVKFSLLDNVSLVGAYAGLNPIGGDTSDTRDLAAYETVLSGDIGNAGDNSDNSYGVVYSHEVLGAVVDGVTIRDGNNDTGSSGGGGCQLLYSDIDLVRVTITDNAAPIGGGIYANGSDVTITRSTIAANDADTYGGGIYSTTNSPSAPLGTVSIVDSVISSNTAATRGGGIRMGTYARVNVDSSTVAGNYADEGGGICQWGSSNGPLTLNNTIVAENYSGSEWSATDVFGSTGGFNSFIGNGHLLLDMADGVDGNMVGTRTAHLDPPFTQTPGPGADATWRTADDVAGDLRLLDDSPAVNVGDNSLLPADAHDLDHDGNTAEPLPVDLDGVDRVFTGDGVGIVDMGAYEATAELDYGDAPDPAVGTAVGDYNTVAADNGPSHTIVIGIHMGASVDDDDGTLQNAAADADDVDQAPDDEDGLVNPTGDLTLYVGLTPSVDVAVTNNTGSAGTLYGWIDYNGDGVFDNTTERASIAVPDGTTAGTVTLDFPAAPLGSASSTYARFRLSTDTVA